MTIVMIGQKGLPARSGGIERHVSLLASGLASRGHRVIVYGRRWYAGGGAVSAGVEQKFSLGFRTKHLDALSHTLTALIAARKDRPDIIHVHGSGVEILIPLVRLLHPRAKIVYTFHSKNESLTKWNGLAKLGLRLSAWIGCRVAHRTVAVSQALVRHCLKAYDCQATYISHPFRAPVMDASAVKDALTAEQLVQDQYLLFVGRLIPDKQAHRLIEAYAQARKAEPELFRNVPLVIVGAAAWTDRYAIWLARLAASVPGVRLMGERHGDPLTALQAHALAHVFPTSSEGLSLAMLEAASLGRPILATDLPQNEEATGGHGLTAKVHDQEDLVRGLIRLLQMPFDERQAMGRRLQAHVAQRFNPTDRLDDLDRLYQELITGTHALTTPIRLQPVRI